jgi:hypothetical protein
MCRKLILDQYCHFDVDKQLDVNMDRAILPMLQIKWAAEELISLPLLVLKKVLIPDRILHWFAFDDFHDDDNDDDDEDGDFFYDDDISDDVSDDDDDDDDDAMVMKMKMTTVLMMTMTLVLMIIMMVMAID